MVSNRQKHLTRSSQMNCSCLHNSNKVPAEFSFLWKCLYDHRCLYWIQLQKNFADTQGSHCVVWSGIFAVYLTFYHKQSIFRLLKHFIMLYKMDSYFPLFLVLCSPCYRIIPGCIVQFWVWGSTSRAFYDKVKVISIWNFLPKTISKISKEILTASP